MKELPEWFSFYPPLSPTKSMRKKGYKQDPKNPSILTAIKNSEADKEINEFIDFMFTLAKSLGK